MIETEAGAGAASPAPAPHRPGAWPAGCQRPQAPPSLPAHVVDAALAEYRQWLAAGAKPGHYPCECGCDPTTARHHALKETS